MANEEFKAAQEKELQAARGIIARYPVISNDNQVTIGPDLYNLYAATYAAAINNANGNQANTLLQNVAVGGLQNFVSYLTGGSQVPATVVVDGSQDTGVALNPQLSNVSNTTFKNLSSANLPNGFVLSGTITNVSMDNVQAPNASITVAPGQVAITGLAVTNSKLNEVNLTEAGNVHGLNLNGTTTNLDLSVSGTANNNVSLVGATIAKFNSQNVNYGTPAHNVADFTLTSMPSGRSIDANTVIIGNGTPEAQVVAGSPIVGVYDATKHNLYAGVALGTGWSQTTLNTLKNVGTITTVPDLNTAFQTLTASNNTAKTQVQSMNAELQTAGYNLDNVTGAQRSNILQAYSERLAAEQLLSNTAAQQAVGISQADLATLKSNTTAFDAIFPQIAAATINRVHGIPAPISEFAMEKSASHDPVALAAALFKGIAGDGTMIEAHGPAKPAAQAIVSSDIPTRAA